jgi:hypothetical protein
MSIRPIKKGSCDSTERGRGFKMCRVTRLCENCDLWIRESVGNSRGDLSELFVLFPDDEENRFLKAVEAIKKGRLGPSAHSAQAVGETVGRICETLFPGVSEGRLAQPRLARKDRQRHPSVDKGLDPFGLNPIGQRFVRLDPSAPKLRIRDPSCRPN